MDHFRHRPNRRDFLRQLGLATVGLALGARRLAAADPAPRSFRFVFASDAHLMVGDAKGSAAGLGKCLEAIEALTPRPAFVLMGGDLTHESPDLDLDPAGRLLDHFLAIWKRHTSLPVHYTFGNHDFAGVKNPGVKRDDPRFGKGLFRARLELARTYRSFDAGGWHFVILDDVVAHADGSYLGEYPAEQLDFIRADLATTNGRPTVLCGHIPSVSVLPTFAGLAKLAGKKLEIPASVVATNTAALLEVISQSQANVRLLLGGHLHHFERLRVDDLSFVNGGAICGDWWRGAQKGCPEGFTVVDLQPDGTFAADYRGYGWKAVS